jgi:hypothetical protein
VHHLHLRRAAYAQQPAKLLLLTTAAYNSIPYHCTNLMLLMLRPGHEGTSSAQQAVTGSICKSYTAERTVSTHQTTAPCMINRPRHAHKRKEERSAAIVAQPVQLVIALTMWPAAHNSMTSTPRLHSCPQLLLLCSCRGHAAEGSGSS